MSLQGSLDAFALPDVLVLLAGTKKSGQLSVSGRRADLAVDGRVWVDAGRLVGADVPRAVDVVDAVFELLRLTEGTFSFEQGEAPAPEAPRDVEPVLADAESRLVEWREIERVVPSLAAWLELSEEPPADQIVLDAEQWRLIVSVAGGVSVADLVERHGRGELAGCRAVKGLVESRLVHLGSPPLMAAGADSTWGGRAANSWSSSWGADPAPAPAPAAWGEPEVSTPPAAVYDGVADAEASPAPAWSFSALAQDADDEATSGVAPVTGDDGAAPDSSPVPDWRAELGDPQDLDAFVALAENRRPTGETAGDAGASDEGVPADEDDDGDEPLNRGLLLKFLSSVRN